MARNTDWMARGMSLPQEEPSEYDVQQVCLNGHQITDVAVRYPQFKKPFCPQCGVETILNCPECSTPIQGEYYVPGFLGSKKTAVPKYCYGCGKAYPWQKAALQAAIDAVSMDLGSEDSASAMALVPAIAIESPGTELAALKLKRLLKPLAKPTYDVVIKVVSDVASATAKKTLGIE